jgi:hypothetical protein
MAIIKLSLPFNEIHGRIGDLLFRRGPNGTTIVSRAPRMKRKKSQKAQKAQKEQNARQQQRMLAAHDYAHAAMRDSKMKAQYEQRAKKKEIKPYLLALSDYLKGETKFGE